MSARSLLPLALLLTLASFGAGLSWNRDAELVSAYSLGAGVATCRSADFAQSFEECLEIVVHLGRRKDWKGHALPASATPYLEATRAMDMAARDSIED